MAARSSAVPARPDAAWIVEKLYAEARAGRFGLRPFGRILIADEPETVEAMFAAPEIFIKDYGEIGAYGASRLNTNGDDWRARQSLTQRRYASAARLEHRAVVAEEYRKRIAETDPDRPKQIPRALFAAASAVFHRALECPADDADANQLMDAIRVNIGKLQSMTLFGAPPDTFRAVSEATGRILASVAAHPPLAPLLARFRDDAGGLPGFRAVEEYVMNFAAAVETSSSTTCWVIDRLSLDAELQDECAEEALRGGELPLIERVINETLRTVPSIPFITRRVASETNLAGQRLEPGSTILISIVGLHHNPDHWDAPFDFNPMRSEFDAGAHTLAAFRPFAGGPRICGGMRLAQLEIKEGVAAFLRHYRVSREPKPARFAVSIAMRPETWDALVFERR